MPRQHPCFGPRSPCLPVRRWPASSTLRSPPTARRGSTRLASRALNCCSRPTSHSGQNAAVVASARGVVAVHPYRERVWAALLLALYRLGRQADALAALRALRETLADGLGLDPSPQIQELEQMILRQDAALEAVRVPAGTEQSFQRAMTTPPEDPFVGRRAELDVIVDTVALATSGAKGRLLVFEGPAGMGKSALLSRLESAVAAAQGVVLRAAGVRAAELPTLWPWVTVVRGIGQSAPDVLRAALDGPGGESLALLDPSLVAGSIPRPGDSSLSRTWLYRAVIDLLRAAHAATPVALLLDDAHWLDTETLDLLVLAVEELLPRGMIFAVALRPEESAQARQAVGGLGAGLSDAVVRLSLARLDTTDVARIVEQVSGSHPGPDVVTAIAARTAGNPFFVLELTRLLVSERRLDTAAVYSALPEGVRQVLRRRLDRLPDQTVAVLTVLALLGRPAKAELLASATAMAPDTVLDACEAAVLAGLLVDDPGLGFVLTHDLIRQTLEEALTPSRRVRWHAGIASALLADSESTGDKPGPDGIVELADQLTRAAPVLGVEQALRYVLLAADDAYNRLALGRSEEFLQTALNLVEQIADPTERARRAAEIHSRLTTGRIMLRTSGTQPVIPDASIGADTIEPLDPDDPGDFYNSAIQLVAAGRNEALFAAAQAEVRPGLPVIADSYVHFFLAMGCFELGRPDEARAAFLRGEQLHRSAPDEGARPILFDLFVAATHGLLAAVETVCGNDDAAAEQLQRARALPDPSPFVLVTIEFWAAWCASQRGNYEFAATVAGQCAVHARGFFYETGAGLLEGWAAAMLGDQAGLHRAEAAYDEYVALGIRHQVTTYQVLLAEARAHHGDLERARELIRESRDWSVRTGELTLGPRLRALADRLLST